MLLRMKKRRIPPPEGLVVKRSSAGLGLFTTGPIKKGARVIEYVGRFISREEEYASRSKYLFEVGRHKTIDGKPHENPAGYINHSCRPNCEPNVVKGRVFIRTIKNVRAGEELTYDYGKEYFDEHIRPRGCRCAKCLSVTTKESAV